MKIRGRAQLCVERFHVFEMLFIHHDGWAAATATVARGGAVGGDFTATPRRGHFQNRKAEKNDQKDEGRTDLGK